MMLEEIIVTATRREMRLQDVPQAITAISDATLVNRGATDLEDYAYSIPNLQIQKLAPGRNEVSLRGIRSLGGDSGAAVGYYLDDTPVSAAGFFPEINAFDIERIEVLRGPQGTLYGEGSMGGTIRLITKKPDTSRYDSAVDGTWSSTRYADDNNYSANVMFNAPLVEDKLAIRIVGFYDETAGFIDDAHRGVKDVNDNRSYGGRFAAGWHLGEDLVITASANVSRSDWGGFSIGTPDLQVARSGAEPGYDDYELYNLTIDYSLSRSQLTSSTSYYDRQLLGSGDVAFALPLINGLYGFFGLGPFSTGTRVGTASTYMLAHETRLVSASPGPLQWAAGVFYKDVTRINGLIGVTDPVVDPAVIETAGRLFFGVPGLTEHFLKDQDFVTRQLAVFGEVSYDLTDRLQVLGGVRVFREKLTINTSTTGIFLTAIANSPPTVFNSNDTASLVNPKMTLSYRLSDDALVYTTASKGFRSSGENSDAALIDPTRSTYDAETLWNYELGLKSTWADGTVTFNGAVFYMDWEDLQAPVAVLTLGALTGNVGTAHSAGVELETVLRPFNGLDVTLGGSWVEAETDEAVNVPLANLPPVVAPEGTRIPGVPEFSFSAAVDYRVPLTERFTALMHADYNHYGSNYLDLLNASQQAGFVESPAFDVVNLRLGIEAGNWAAALFVRNLTDERALHFFDADRPAGSGGLLGLGNQYTVNQPRTVGLNVSFRM